MKKVLKLANDLTYQLMFVTVTKFQLDWMQKSNPILYFQIYKYRHVSSDLIMPRVHTRGNTEVLQNNFVIAFSH